MKWTDLQLNSNEYASVSFSICSACKDPSIWITDEGGGRHGLTPGMPMEGHLGSRIKWIFPSERIAPRAEEDMPEGIKADYEEARLVFNHSPRAAAALLRLCVQKLCEELLGKPGKSTIKLVSLSSWDSPAGC
ncbi:hypothetical protein PflCFBP13510_19600 [Pseudomonas fluorescens]|nr:hypothetical protein PflCFBP13510_19600 [Pseudomonas fluorescens]